MRLKHLVLLLIIFIIIFTFFYFYDIYRTKPPEPKKEPPKKLYIFKPEQVDRLILKNKDTEIILDKQNNTWQMTKPIVFAGDADNIEYIINKMNSIEYDKELTVPEARLSEFGLQPAHLIITLLTGNKIIADLAAGIKNPTAGFIYAKDNLTNKICLIPADFQTYFAFDIFKMQYKKLTDFKSEQVKSIEIYPKTNPIKLELVNTFWYITKPKKVLADNAKISSFLASMEFLKAEKYENEKNLVQYGLDKPAYRVVISMDKESQVIISFGQPAENTAYAMISKNPVIAKVAISFLDDLKKEWPEWREKKPIIFFPFDVQRFIIKYGSNITEIAKDKDENWIIVQPPLKKSADSSKIESLFNTINRFEAIDMIDEAGDLSQYSFNPKNALILYVNENDKIAEKSIILGKIDQDKQKLYIMNNQNKAVFAISSDFLVLMQRQANVYLP